MKNIREGLLAIEAKCVTQNQNIWFEFFSHYGKSYTHFNVSSCFGILVIVVFL